MGTMRMLEVPCPLRDSIDKVWGITIAKISVFRHLPFTDDFGCVVLGCFIDEVEDHKLVVVDGRVIAKVHCDSMSQFT